MSPLFVLPFRNSGNKQRMSNGASVEDLAPALHC